MFRHKKRKYPNAPKIYGILFVPTGLYFKYAKAITLCIDRALELKLYV